MHDIQALTERAKELRCLYAIDSIVSNRQQSPRQAFEQVLRVIPSGWQDAASTDARIEYLGHNYVGTNFAPDGFLISAPIRLWDTEIGRVWVSLRKGDADGIDRTFLSEEDELLRRIAARLSEYLEWKHAELLGQQTPSASAHWAWRQRFAEALADSIDADRFGVSRLYLGGSTARGDAGPASDIDIYIRCEGSPSQHDELLIWLDGWSQCLAEFALQQTGQSFPGGILNIQWLVGDAGNWQQTELQELKLRTNATGRIAQS